MSSATVIEMPKKKSLLDKAMCLSVTRRWPSLSKTVSSTLVKDVVDPKMIHVSKDLFDSPELKALFSYDARIDNFLDSICLPFPLKKGIYLLPRDLFSQAEQRLTDHVDGMKPYLEAIGEKYDEIVARSKEKLGPHADDTDYASKEAFLASFRFTWNYLQFGINEQLVELNKQVAQREQDKLNAVMMEAESEIRSVLRLNMQQLVSHMVDRLTPGEDGKKKIFRNTMLDNLNGFLETFKARNLADDDELGKLVEQAKALTSGVDPESLRTNEALRNSLQVGFAKIKESIDKMVTEAPSRSMRFD